MLLVWLASYFFYLVGPIKFYPELSIKGSLFIFSSIIVFILGSLPLINRKKNYNQSQLKDCLKNKDCISQVDNSLMLIGILGTFFLIVDKLIFLNELNLSSFSELRAGQAIAVRDADSIILSDIDPFKIGYFLYPAGFVAAVSFWLNIEFVKRYQKIMLFIFTFMIITLNVFSGQRSIMFIFILFILIACYVRTFFASFMPRNKLIQLIGSLALLFLILYSSTIFEIRSGSESLSLYIDRMDETWNTIVKPEWLSLMQTLFPDSFIKFVVSSFSYFLQNLSVTDKIILLDNPKFLYGGYSSDLIASLFRIFYSGTEYLQASNLALLEENIYGFFSGSWAGTYLDFGIFAYLIFFLWGRLSGSIYRNVRDVKAHHFNVLFVFVIFFILISPISNPFGFSNSLMTIFWLMIYAFFASRRQIFSKR